MSEVVRLRGEGPVSHPGNPDKTIIMELERLLEMARVGEVTGLTYAIEYFDGSTGGKIVGACSRSLIGRLFGLAMSVTQKLDDIV